MLEVGLDHSLLDKLNGYEKDIDELKSIIGELNSNYELTLYGFGQEMLIMRGRWFSEDYIPLNQKELSYPPPNLVTSNNRANRAGTSMFYAASDFKTMFEEITPPHGSFIYVSYWWIKNPMYVVPIGYTSEVIKLLGSNMVVNTFISDERYHSKVSKDYRTAYYYREFTRQNIIDNKRGYNLSIAIAEHFFTPAILDASKNNSIYQNVYLDELGRTSKVADAIIYPTVRNNGNGNNLAIRPEFVESSLELKRVDCFKLDFKEKANLKLVRFANYSNKQNLQWHEVKEGYTSWGINSQSGFIIVLNHNGHISGYKAKDGIQVDPAKIKFL